MVKVGEQGIFLSDDTAKKISPYILSQLKKTLVLNLNSVQSSSETDPVFTAWLATPPNVSTFTNDAGYLTSFSETDPIYTTSSWYSTTNNSSNWDTAFSWGNHASAGYLTSITSGQVTTALGYTPYNATNPSGYITSGSLSGYLQNNVGISGGTTLIGGTLSGNNLTLSSTSNATKGKILFGTSAYDEVNDRLGIGTASPAQQLEITKNFQLPNSTATVGNIYKNGALFLHNFGTTNVFLGKGTGNLTLSGGYNSAIGFDALNSLTSGGFNMAVGRNALNALTSGTGNVGIGNSALSAITTQNDNAAIGNAALYGTKSVSSVAIGTLAGGALSGTQTGATFIGYGATSSPGGLTNATAIGYNAIVGASNSLVLGGTGSYAVNVGIGQTSPTARLHIAAGTATAGTAPIKLTSGTNLTTPENGALEFDGTNLYFTTGGVRKTVQLI